MEGEKIKVLIVDDEFIMRQGLRYMIAWEKEGYTIIGEASNGKEAFDLIEKERPDIVISDIVMPLMDGVDFTVAVHHRFPDIQMIILSGYDKFEYVKQTFMNGVVDYILKPTLTPHEVLTVLKKAAKNIPGYELLTNGSQKDEEKILEEILSGEKLQGEEELTKYFNSSNYCLYAVNIANTDHRKENITPVYEKIVRTLEEPQEVECCTVILKNMQICVLFGYEMSQRSILRIKIQKLNGQIEMLCPTVVGILSSPFTNLEQVADTYQRELARGVDLLFYFPDKRLFIMEDETAVHRIKVQKFDFGKYNRLLLGGQYHQAAEQLLEYNHALCENHMDVFRMKNQIKNMTMVFLDMLELDEQEKEILHQNFIAEMDSVSCREDYEQILEKNLNHLIAIWQEASVRTDNRIEQILDYMELHYTEDLKLEEIGARFGFSYHYLSAYFNQTMKEGFNDYLNRIRIHKSCEILQNPMIPVAQVSEIVGYSGHSYFCRVFKKFTGKTPSEWRRDYFEK